MEASLADAVATVTAALKNEGFGVLTEINVKDTLRKKLDVDFRGYVILGACNPSLAHKALTAEPQIGLLLPCNVVVQEAADGGVVVTIADPRAMFSLVDNPSLAPVVQDAESRLRRVVESLA
ncbi:MAG: ABC transporter ATP-binding protein [Acidobacteria bacterium RIFCSPLOWO2_02_FULL_68_18]|nr:MAG: ABC transporter ATP-binding protein [Acidobacteria bacterium RIFCSPLOWO2_02_FULL_68_18]OFW48127.1 MAG: ABC transporter ATP-binding protein [Acidobacteria bacterium RIFCSPLOWO2_12_FULL_68_19]